ncbi:MAG: type II toxin-antitoxin system ParD family antitoxin [Methylococcaceae bacterium]|jgi:antitoxin ParD1/3/4
MNISLNPHFEELVKGKIESGLYHTASEVMREALRLLEERDQLRELHLEKLRQDIKNGLNSGEATPLDIETIKAKGRERMTS